MSNRITNIQREIQPDIQVSGMQYGLTKRFVTRKLAFNLQLGAASKTVTTDDLKLLIPSGAKILALRVRSLAARWVRVSIGSNTGLAVNVPSGSGFYSSLDRWAAAPLSRFPTIKVNIPDLLAATINTSASPAVELFTVYQSGTDFGIELTLTVKYMA